MFMQIAIGALGIGIVLMVGFIIIAQVRVALPTPQTTYNNSCFGSLNESLGIGTNATYCGSAATHCDSGDNASATITCDNEPFVAGITGTQATVFAGFGLVAVGIIVLAAFGLINVFK